MHELSSCQKEAKIPVTDDFTIKLTAPVNLRDLGGLPVADGVIADGFALRSDDLATITADAAEQLVEAGMRNVIDLRSKDEVFITGRGPLLDHAVRYHHIPLLGSIREAAGYTGPEAAAVAAAATAANVSDAPPMSTLYIHMVERSPEALVTALAVMAHAEGASAFHCAAGKDRTGILAAVLLLGLGADDETIIEDYRRTYENLADITERAGAYMSQVMARAGFDMSALRARADADQERQRSEQAMADTLRSLREKYSDPLLPLRQAGLTPALEAALRERGIVASP